MPTRGHYKWRFTKANPEPKKGESDGQTAGIHQSKAWSEGRLKPDIFFMAG